MADPRAEALFGRAGGEPSVPPGPTGPSTEGAGAAARSRVEALFAGAQDRQARYADVVADLPEALPPDLSDPKLRLFRGAVRGVAQLLDLVTMAGEPRLAELRGRGVDVAAPPTVFQDLARRGFETVGLPGGGEGTDLVEKVGEELGAGALTGGIGGRVARGLGGRLAAEAPSAVGAAVGREVFEGEGPGAEIAGGLGGGLAGAGLTTSRRAAVRAGRRVAQPTIRFARDVIRGRVGTAKAQRLAAAHMQAMVDDRVRALVELDRVEALRQQSPGFDPTLGAATGDPGLRSLETEVFRHRTGDGPTALDLELARSSGNRAIREDFLALRPGGNEAEARAAVRAHLERRIEAIEAHAAASRGAGAESSSRLAREEYQRLSQEWKDATGKGFDDLEAEARRRSAVVPSQPITSAHRRIVREVGRFENLRLPRDLSERLHALAEEPLVSFADVRSLERRLNAEYGVAKNANDRALLSQLTALKKGVARALDALGAPGVANPTIEQRKTLEILRRHGGPEYPDLAEAYRNLKSTFEEGAARFREGRGGALARRRGGRLKVAESETLGLFWQPGAKGADAADEFLSVFKDSPATKAAMQDYIVDQALRGVLDETGSLASTAEVSRRISGYVSRHREAFERFPEALDRVRGVERLTREAEEAGLLGLPRSQRAVLQGALRLYVDEPAEAVRRIFELPAEQQARAIDQLRLAIGSDTRALQGLRQTAWDELEAQVVRLDPEVETLASEFVDPRLLQQAMLDAQPALTRIFPSDHLARLDRILDMASRNARIFIPRAEKLLPEFTPATTLAGSGIFNQFLGRGARAIRGFRLVTRLADAMGVRQMNELLRKAALDPELSRVLLTPLTSRNEKRIVEFVASNLTTLPLRVFASENQTPAPVVQGVGGP